MRNEHFFFLLVACVENWIFSRCKVQYLQWERERERDREREREREREILNGGVKEALEWR